MRHFVKRSRMRKRAYVENKKIDVFRAKNALFRQIPPSFFICAAPHIPRRAYEKCKVLSVGNTGISRKITPKNDCGLPQMRLLTNK